MTGGMTTWWKSWVLAAVFAGVAAEGARAGTVRTVAGTGVAGGGGDGGPAVEAQLNEPFAVTRGPDGLLYVCEFAGHRIRSISPDGRIATVAGTGVPGSAGDGGPAREAQLNRPHEIRTGPDGRLYISDMSSHAVRAIDLRSGRIERVAGSGERGFGGDGGPAVEAKFHDPISIEFGPDGGLYVCDIGNHRIRRVDPETGIATTVCGNGRRETPPDGAPFSPETPLNGPRSLAFDTDGNLWIALREGNALLKMDAASRTLRRVAGTGESGLAGNGGPPASAQLAGPKGIALTPDGRVILADTESHTIRLIDFARDRITILAGDGTKGDGPDGPAAACRLNRPHGVFLDADGTLFIGDSSNHRLRILTGLEARREARPGR